jgi:hypothetical protein
LQHLYHSYDAYILPKTQLKKLHQLIIQHKNITDEVSIILQNLISVDQQKKWEIMIDSFDAVKKINHASINLTNDNDNDNFDYLYIKYQHEIHNYPWI